MSPARLHLSLAAALALCAAPIAAQQLVNLPTGTWAYDITPDGEVVVGSSGSDGFIWRWRVDPAPTIVPGGYFTGVSDDGTVLCGNIDPSSESSTAGIWTEATGWQSLGFVPGTPATCGGGLSSAYDISGDGTTIVGLAWINGCDGAGFRWTAATGLQTLQHLANGHNRCSAISGDGLSLGGFAQGSFSRTPAYWAPDTSGFVVDPNLQGEVYNFTEDGSQSVGTLYFSGSLYTAFVRDTQSGVFTNLHQLQSGWAAAASDLSEDGSVIVGFDYISLSRKAWVWTSGDGIVSMADRLAAYGMTGLPNFLVCSAVSDDGTVVVGGAQPVGGGAFSTAGFIVELVPPHWTSAGVGLAGTAGVPKLAASGPLTGGSPTSVVLTQGKPSAPAAFVVGLTAVNLPFKQGVLVPFPDHLLLIPALSSHGSVGLSFNWPNGLPSGFALYWQVLINDAVAPAGFALSNALQSLTP